MNVNDANEIVGGKFRMQQICLVSLFLLAANKIMQNKNKNYW